MNVLKENIFYEFNNRLFKKEVYSDTVYLFEDQNFILHMVIEQSENLLTPGAKSKQSFEEIHVNFYIQRRLFEVGDFVFYKFLNGHTPDKRIIINAFKNSNPKYPEKKKELEALAASLNENDNPVLMLAKLKK